MDPKLFIAIDKKAPVQFKKAPVEGTQDGALDAEDLLARAPCPDRGQHFAVQTAHLRARYRQ
jgi:hypothetical protein